MMSMVILTLSVLFGGMLASSNDWKALEENILRLNNNRSSNAGSNKIMANEKVNGQEGSGRMTTVTEFVDKTVIRNVVETVSVPNWTTVTTIKTFTTTRNVEKIVEMPRTESVTRTEIKIVPITITSTFTMTENARIDTTTVTVFKDPIALSSAPKSIIDGAGRRQIYIDSYQNEYRRFLAEAFRHLQAKKRAADAQTIPRQQASKRTKAKKSQQARWHSASSSDFQVPVQKAVKKQARIPRGKRRSNRRSSGSSKSGSSSSISFMAKPKSISLKRTRVKP